MSDDIVKERDAASRRTSNDRFRAWGRDEGWNEALNALAEYLKCPVPPIPDERLREANAAAEKRGAAAERAAVVEWLRAMDEFADPHQLADALERRAHVRADTDV